MMLRASLCVCGLAIASLASPVHAQKAGTRGKADSTDTANKAAKAGRRDVSLAEAIAIALEHNGDLFFAKTETAVASDDIAIADSVFVPSLLSEVRVSSQQNPPSSTIPEYDETVAFGSIGITGRRPIGLSYTLSMNTRYDSLKANNTIVPVSYYDPGYTTSFALSLTQPLLRGAGSRANRATIVVATHRKEVSEHQLRVQVQRVVGNVVVAYWTLALAYKEIEARESQLKVAEDQVAESQRLVKLGSLSDLDITEARAAVARQRQQLLRSEQAAIDSEAKLRTLLLGGGAPWAPDQRLVPSDSADVGDAPGTVEQHVQIARKNRPDIALAQSQVEADRAGLAVTEDALKPVLDVFATGSVIGFAGDPVAAIDPATFDPDYTGGGGRAFSNLGRGDFQVSVGLRLELPLSGAGARARNARQRRLVTRSQNAEERIGAQVRNDVQTAIALLSSDLAQREAADGAVADNEKLLAGMRKRFNNGLITSFDVLRVADQLALSRIEAARTRASYQVSRARLATADGTLLQSLNIKLSP